jgi:hypothetical protein
VIHPAVTVPGLAEASAGKARRVSVAGSREAVASVLRKVLLSMAGD